MRKPGFSDYEKELLAEKGLTPESAIELVVKKLRKANLPEEHVKRWAKPADQLDAGEADYILCWTVYYPNEPDEWIKRTGKDFSNIDSYLQCMMYINY